MNQDIRLELEEVLGELGRDFPRVSERVGAITGLGIGGATLVGFQAVGGLGVPAFGVLGVLFGGVATTTLFALTPVALGGLVGYGLLKKYNNKKRRTASFRAMGKLHGILDRLKENRDECTKERQLIEEMMQSLEEIIVESP